MWPAETNLNVTRAHFGNSHVPGGIRTHAPCEIGALIQRLRPTRPRKLMNETYVETALLICKEYVQ
eukprot:scaffold56152_cov61-Phaeocystis_antarctica.AAC.3